MSHSNENDINHQSKIIKPEELRYLDAYPHLKSNIVNYLKNCREPINEYSYYCFTCKHSVCSECGIYDHNDHLLIQRENCLKYDQTFFVEIGKVIDESLLLENKKESVKASINNSITQLHAKLEEIKQIKLNAVDEIFNDIKVNLMELKQNFESVKESIEEYYYKNEKFFNINFNNIDQENTVFVMNFEIMNLCDNKNLEVLESINHIKDYIDHYNKIVDDRTYGLEKELDHYLDMDCQFDKFDDFYWDVKLRTKKYTEHIASFQQSILDIVKQQGSYDKLYDLVEIMDSKHKKGVDVIFNQDYFIMKETIEEDASQRKMKIRGNSKTHLLTHNKSGVFSTNKTRTLSNGNLLTNTNGTASPKHSPLNPLSHLNNKDDIHLDSRVLQRFFAYSLLDVYGKLFAQKKELPTTTASFNYMNHYMQRYNQLKETAKPIIGTNDITIYNKRTTLLNRIKVNLDKEIHGYTVFPDGCRHILIENNLYITGGVDSIKTPINIALCFDIKANTIERLNPLIRPHSYHTIEYLENYECLIIIGGENNSNCELFDLFSRKWTKLPELNFPRANVNVYFDPITSDLYALFGMENSISELSNNTDIIEVLEMKDIISGWFRVDYYKSADLNFRMNYCSVFPFTKDTLLVYGGNKARIQKKLFALYHMNKNEVIKADEKTMEQIKVEEKKIRNVEYAIEKMKTVT